MRPPRRPLPAPTVPCPPVLPRRLRPLARRPRPLRRLLTLVGLLLLLLAPGLSGGGPALAAAPAAASEARMALYQKVAALNYCVARSSGLDDGQALPLAAQTIALLLRNEHGGRIAQVGQQPLPGETLLQGSAELTLLGARQLCPQEVPEEVSAKLDQIRSEQAAAAAAENGGETAPIRP